LLSLNGGVMKPILIWAGSSGGAPSARLRRPGDVGESGELGADEEACAPPPLVAARAESCLVASDLMDASRGRSLEDCAARA
jgi:hypothetical protein